LVLVGGNPLVVMRLEEILGPLRLLLGRIEVVSDLLRRRDCVEGLRPLASAASGRREQGASPRAGATCIDAPAPSRGGLAGAGSIRRAFANQPHNRALQLSARRSGPAGIEAGCRPVLWLTRGRHPVDTGFFHGRAAAERPIR
jgi:hypothetical protein